MVKIKNIVERSNLNVKQARSRRSVMPGGREGCLRIAPR